jgi:L-histidine N-alpha-methyltransferase
MIDPNFLNDVDKGLSASPKFLSSKYFYDDRGSELFREIMELPEYYLTNAEYEIFESQSGEIAQLLGTKEINVTELGAGDGSKTIKLLEGIIEKDIHVRYYPIDISSLAIEQAVSNVSHALPKLEIIPHTGDYFEELKKINSPDVHELVLFLGANIGNYSYDDALDLLKFISNAINPGDFLLLGVDRRKNPATIAAAYNDNTGVTKDFNLNLLARINRELGGDFNIKKFDFYSNYDPESGNVKSYITSLENQVVQISALNKEFNFEKNELIYTELSKKYHSQELVSLANAAGFELVLEFNDDNQYFAEFLLKKSQMAIR